MDILAKAILDSQQIEARKRLGVKGIELLLLDKDFRDLDKTKEALIRIAQEWEIVALEAPDSTKEYRLNPFSADSKTRVSSRDFLLRYVELANSVNNITKNIAYAQFQYIFDGFDDKGRPVEVDRERQLGEIREHYESLRRNSQVELQIENITQINPAYADGSLCHCYTTTRPSDFPIIGTPLALDVIHLAQVLYTWLKTEPTDEDKNIARVKIPGMPQFGGGVYIQMTDEDKKTAERIKKEQKETNLRETITSELVRVIKFYRPLIGSLQFANASVGFGAFPGEDGVASDTGLIDLKRVFQEAIIPANVPYVIPEYRETDWLNPLNQQNAIAMVRRLSEEYSKRE